MELHDFIELLDAESERLSTRNCVLQLCAPDVTDYDRGRIQGQIEMLTRLYTRLTSNETSEDYGTDE